MAIDYSRSLSAAEADRQASLDGLLAQEPPAEDPVEEMQDRTVEQEAATRRASEDLAKQVADEREQQGATAVLPADAKQYQPTAVDLDVKPSNKLDMSTVKEPTDMNADAEGETLLADTGVYEPSERAQQAIDHVQDQIDTQIASQTKKQVQRQAKTYDKVIEGIGKYYQLSQPDTMDLLSQYQQQQRQNRHEPDYNWVQDYEKEPRGFAKDLTAYFKQDFKPSQYVDRESNTVVGSPTVAPSDIKSGRNLSEKFAEKEFGKDQGYSNDHFVGFVSAYNDLSKTKLGQALQLHDFEADLKQNPDHVTRYADYYRQLVDKTQPKSLSEMPNGMQLGSSMRNRLVNTYIDTKFNDTAHGAEFAADYMAKAKDPDALVKGIVNQPSAVDQQAAEYLSNHGDKPEIVQAWSKILNKPLASANASSMADFMYAYNQRFKSDEQAADFVGDVNKRMPFVKEAVRDFAQGKLEAKPQTPADYYLDHHFDSPEKRDQFLSSFKDSHPDIDYQQLAKDDFPAFKQTVNSVDDILEGIDPADLVSDDDLQAQLEAEQLADDRFSDEGNATEHSAEDEDDATKAKQSSDQQEERQTQRNQKQNRRIQREKSAEADEIMHMGADFKGKHPGMVGYTFDREMQPLLHQSMVKLHGQDKRWMDRTAILKSGAVKAYLTPQELTGFTQTVQDTRRKQYQQQRAADKQMLKSMQDSMNQQLRKEAHVSADDKSLARTLGTKALIYELGRRSAMGVMRATQNGVNRLKIWWNNRQRSAGQNQPRPMDAFERAMLDKPAERAVVENQNVSIEDDRLVGL